MTIPKKIVLFTALTLLLGGGYYFYQFVLEKHVDPQIVPDGLLVSIGMSTAVPDPTNEVSKFLRNWLKNSPTGWFNSPASYANVKCLTAISSDKTFIAVICSESVRLMMGTEQYIKTLGSQDKVDIGPILDQIVASANH